MSDTFTKPISGYRLVTIQDSDTPKTIAARELGDASQWTDIVNLNGLVPPWIGASLADVAPGVLLPGQSIKIPSTAPAASGVADPDAVFGIDVALVGGQLASDGNGGILTVSGPDNLVQALENALATHTGELLGHLTYGCDAYKILGLGANPSDMQLAGAFVARTCNADPRVSSVQSGTASVIGDAVSVQAVVVPIVGKKLPVGPVSGSA